VRARVQPPFPSAPSSQRSAHCLFSLNMGWCQKIAMQLAFMPVAWFALVWWQQDSMIYRPRLYNKPLDQKSWLDQGMNVTELRFAGGEDGEQVALLVWPRQSSEPARQLYAVFGGNAMFARDWLNVLSHHRNADWNSAAFVLVDFPGFGFSSGTPCEASIGRAARRALSEARAALLAEDAGAEPLLGVIGHSIGCAAALKLAADGEPGASQIRHLVLSSPFSSIPAIAQEMLPPLRVLPLSVLSFFAGRNAWDNLAAAGRIAAVCVETEGSTCDAQARVRVDIIHSTEDEMCPFSHGQELAERFRRSGVQVHFTPSVGGHNEILFSSEFGEWLRHAMKQASA